MTLVQSITPTPTPYQFPYKNPIIPKGQSYRIIIVGDSIVNSLGLNANVLREDLIKYYPDSEFVTYNYGYPSTNVLSLYQRLRDICAINIGVCIAIILPNNKIAVYCRVLLVVNVCANGKNRST